MDVKEAIGNVELTCGKLQDLFAPELRGIAVRIEALDKRIEDGTEGGVRGRLRESVSRVCDEVHAVESRLREYVERAQREIVLTLRIMDTEQRHAVLRSENDMLKQKVSR